MNEEDRRLSLAEREAEEYFRHRQPENSLTSTSASSTSTFRYIQGEPTTDQIVTEGATSPRPNVSGGIFTSEETGANSDKPSPHERNNIVEFDGPNDPTHPQNWPIKKKLIMSVALCYVALACSFGSAIFSAAVDAVSEEYNVSTEVTLLGISLYVLGFATGPMVWAPFSELYGRKPPILISTFLFCIFNIAVATGRDLQTILICRFFSGFMGACPLTVVAAVYADIYDNRYRGMSVTLFSMAVFCGPLLSPCVGGFTAASYLGWRWTMWITAIMGALGLVLELLVLEETYPPVILVHKADRLRRATGDWSLHAKQEEIELSLGRLWEENLSRPLRMLFAEPIVLSMSVYVAFVYGLLYLFLEFYPIVYRQTYGMRPGVGELPYFGMIVGECAATLAIVLDQPAYNRKLAANNNVSVPEWRLPVAMMGAVAFPAGLFWFAWSGYTGKVHWIVPTLSGLLTGFGLMTIFQQCLNYLIDAYLEFAASAVAANTFLRSMFAAVFPLFANYMVHGLGVQWAGTLLGCVAVLLAPLPVLFYLKGPAIRARSKFTSGSSAAEQDKDEKDAGV